MNLRFVTPSKIAARDWLGSWWPRRARAQALALDYAAAVKAHPLVFADIMRRGMMFDDLQGETAEDTAINIGMHRLAVHIRTMTDLDPSDLAHLETETDHE